MADDIGFEGIGINGSLSYDTPVLDSLASNGINFTKAFSQPLVYSVKSQVNDR